MAKQIGNFNGRALYSDKSVQSINNLRVNFSDGSWIDMASGEKYVRGHDDIMIDPPFSGSSSIEKVTVGPKTYAATNLDIRNVPACAVSVEPHAENTVIVVLHGNKAKVETLLVKHESDTVYIESAEVRSGGGINISGGSIHIGGIGRGNVMSVGNIRMGGISISGNNIIMIGGSGSEPQATITVKVPKGVKVNLHGEWHSAKVGNTEGNLTVSASGGGNVSAGRIKNANIAIKGSSDVAIDEANGNVSIRIMGSGDVHVNGGTIGSLNTDIMGSGDVYIHTETDEADLSVMGSGDIYVARVKNRPSKNVSGTGSIKVGNW